jgi:hypothetical protein
MVATSILLMQCFVCQTRMGKTVITECQFMAKLDKNATNIYRMSKQVYVEITINITESFLC